MPELRRGSRLLIPASFYAWATFGAGAGADTMIAAHSATDPGKTMSTQEHFRQRLRATFPVLAIGRVEVIAAGQHNHVVRVNDELIFRFPRFPAAAGQLRAEVALLDALAPHLTTPIPRPIYRALSPPPGDLPFVGYRALPGDTLGVARIAHLATPTRARLAEGIGRFLHELHGIAPASLGGLRPAHGDPHAAWWGEWRTLHARLQTRVFPRVSEDVRARIADTFVALCATGNPPITLTPIHGDFGCGNWLCDDTNGALTGVIDFGSARLGDPACDLAGVLVCGEAFTHAALAMCPELVPALPRARRYRATFAAQEALYGVEHGDEDAFTRGVAPYYPASADA